MHRADEGRRRIVWHITFGTYGARLHGGDRPTVERAHNQPGEPFLHHRPALEAAERSAMKHPSVRLTLEMRSAVQAWLPGICTRGGWILKGCAAREDHVHVLLHAPREADGHAIRSLIKRWLSQELTSKFGLPPSGSWWAKGGSTKAIRDRRYFAAAMKYIMRQRTTQ